MTNYTQWKSLVDLHEYSAIPDSGADHQWNYTAGSGTLVSDTIGSLDADFTGLDWVSGSGAGNVYGELDGVDDIADLGSGTRSGWLHFVEDHQGTLFWWVRPESGEDLTICGCNDFASDERGFFLHLFGNAVDSDIEFFMSDGESQIVRDDYGNIPTESWSAVALVCDGSDALFYQAVPATNYDVELVGSASIDADSGSGDLERNVVIGDKMTARGDNFAGGMDISFKDQISWTESELQSFVDDSKGLFE